MSADTYGRHHRHPGPFSASTSAMVRAAQMWRSRDLTGQHRPEVRRLVSLGVMRDDLFDIAATEMLVRP